MHNSDLPESDLTRYRLLTKRGNPRGVTELFARTDLTHWLYTTANGQGAYSGYGSVAEMDRDKKQLAKNGVILIDSGLLGKC